LVSGNLLLFWTFANLLFFAIAGTMPELIAQTNMDMQATNRLREEISKLAMWLSKHSEKYFTTQYLTAEDTH
jgi:hypothetical protein